MVGGGWEGTPLYGTQIGSRVSRCHDIVIFTVGKNAPRGRLCCIRPLLLTHSSGMKAAGG